MSTRSRDSSRFGYNFEQDVIDKLTKLQNTVANIVELLESMDERLKRLEERAEGRRPKPAAGRRSYRIKVASDERKEAKKTAIEIMEEQGVVFESDLKSIKNKEKFVEHLKKAGVIVLEGSKERVLVTKRYLDSFTAELRNCRGPAEAEEKLKDEKMFRLYRFLRDGGFLTYDSRSGWSLHV